MTKILLNIPEGDDMTRLEKNQGCHFIQKNIFPVMESDTAGVSGMPFTQKLNVFLKHI